MSGLFGTLNVGNKGMQAAQTALHTTGHNISNANTEGYSRQRVDLKADLAFTLGGVGQLGTGVKMTGVARLVDDFVTKQIRGENGTLTKFAAKSEVMEQLEIIYNEPSDTSLNFNLGEMFDAWTELSKNPELLTAKSIVVEKSKTMADTLNHIANQLEGLKDNTTGLIEMNAKDFNETVESLNSLNSQIFNIAVKDQVPNDLLDQRDLLLKDLSSITNFDTSFDKYGRVSINIGNSTVLDKDGVKLEMSMVTKVNSDGTVSVSKGGDSLSPDITFTGTGYVAGQVVLNSKAEDFADTSDVVSNPSITSGEISGNRDALVEIDEQISKLNDFAEAMANEINATHGDPIFTFDKDGSDITARNMQVNQAIQNDNSLIQAGQTPDGPEGDGSRALEVAKVRNKKLAGYDNTIEGIYNGMVTNVGISKQQADNMVSNQEVLLDQLVMRRESTSGVNIDEEVSNMIKFQKSFDANARVIQVLSEMLDTLINRTGV